MGPSIWTIFIPAVVFIALLWLGHLLHKRGQKNFERYRHSVEQNVMAMSRILLSSLAAQVDAAEDPANFRRDETRTIQGDRADAAMVVDHFINWYNIAVAPAVQLSHAFEDLLVSKVSRFDEHGRMMLVLHLGQGNDVIRHVLPDYALQPFITRVRALNSYLEIGTSTKQ